MGKSHIWGMNRAREEAGLIRQVARIKERQNNPVMMKNLRPESIFLESRFENPPVLLGRDL